MTWNVFNLGGYSPQPSLDGVCVCVCVCVSRTRLYLLISFSPAVDSSGVYL